MNKIKHLEEAGMGYFPHLRRSLRFSFFCFLSFAKSLIHGFIPKLFTNTSIELEERLERFAFEDE